MSKIKLEELQIILWDAAVLLRTHIDAGSYKQYIFPLLFFKRLCDVYDEEYERAFQLSGGDAEFASFEENHSFSIPTGAHWNDIRSKSLDIGQAIVRLLCILSMSCSYKSPTQICFQGHLQ